jgi:hypothetical protein
LGGPPQQGFNLGPEFNPKPEIAMSDKRLSAVTKSEVEDLFAKREQELHRKVDETRDAYLGFIFPVNQQDFQAVAQALDLNAEAARTLYIRGKAFSTFKPNGRGGRLTNHIVGSSFLALRGKDLNTGLGSVTDPNLEHLVSQHEDIVMEIADARVTWFGRIYFPATAFSNAIAVFGGKASPDAIYALAEKYGFAAKAGNRKTVRGDFGIGVWLTLLGTAP